MKTSFFLTTFCLICLSAFIVYSKFQGNNGDTSVCISENNDTYELKASYNATVSEQVLQYIDRSIAPAGASKPGSDYFDLATQRIDVTTILSDKTQFYIKESPGRLKIVLDKHKNSYNSYERIKNICEGVKNVISGK